MVNECADAPVFGPKPRHTSPRWGGSTSSWSNLPMMKMHNTGGNNHTLTGAWQKMSGQASLTAHGKRLYDVKKGFGCQTKPFFAKKVIKHYNTCWTKKVNKRSKQSNTGWTKKVAKRSKHFNTGWTTKKTVDCCFNTTNFNDCRQSIMLQYVCLSIARYLDIRLLRDLEHHKGGSCRGTFER